MEDIKERGKHIGYRRTLITNCLYTKSIISATTSSNESVICGHNIDEVTLTTQFESLNFSSNFKDSILSKK